MLLLNACWHCACASPLHGRMGVLHRTLLQHQVWLDRTSAEVQSSVTTLCKLTATYLVS